MSRDAVNRRKYDPQTVLLGKVDDELYINYNPSSKPIGKLHGKCAADDLRISVGTDAPTSIEVIGGSEEDEIHDENEDIHHVPSLGISPAVFITVQNRSDEDEPDPEIDLNPYILNMNGCDGDTQGKPSILRTGDNFQGHGTYVTHFSDEERDRVEITMAETPSPRTTPRHLRPQWMSNPSSSPIPAPNFAQHRSFAAAPSPRRTISIRRSVPPGWYKANKRRKKTRGGVGGPGCLHNVVTPVPSLARCKASVQKRLSCAYPRTLYAMETQFSEVKNVLEASLSGIDSGKGVNNSASLLLVGPNGTGKSAVVQMAIKRVKEACDEKCYSVNSFHVVQLHGAIHDTDASCYSRIEAQLETPLRSNGYLRHGERMSAHERFQEVVEAMNQRDVSNGFRTPTFFILEEFDLFAKRHRQTFLYTLLDLIQQPHSPTIVVIGLSATISVLEALEKRVQSRFSDKCIVCTYPKSLKCVGKILTDALLVSDKDCADEAVRNRWNDGVNVLFRNVLHESSQNESGGVCGVDGDDELERRRTREGCDDQVQEDSATAYRLLEERFQCYRALPNFLNLMSSAVCGIQMDEGCIGVHHLEAAIEREKMDPRLRVLETLTPLEMALIMTMNNLEGQMANSARRTRYNFEKVYKEFQGFARENYQWVGRSIVSRAMENLLNLQLVMRVGRTKSIPRDFVELRSLVSTDQFIKFCNSAASERFPTKLMRWGKSWLE